MTTESSFERLRDEVASDLEPVRSLRPAWSSALVAIPVAIFLLSFVLVVYGIRNDAGELGFWPLWGPAAAMVAVAYGILVLALTQRAPEASTSWMGFVLLPALAVLLQIGTAYWTQRFAAAPPPVAWDRQAVCFGRIAFLGLPPVLLALWLLSRGLPLRPRVAGLSGGLAGGLLSEAVYRLHCGLSHPAHVVPWHTGAVLVLALAGLLAGLGWERRRLQRFLDARG